MKPGGEPHVADCGTPGAAAMHAPSPPSAAPGAGGPVRRGKRWRRAAAWGLVFVAAVAAVAWFAWRTGRPQIWLISWAGQRALGAEVIAEGVELGHNRLRIARIQMGDEGRAPLATVESLEVGFQLALHAPRYITGMSAGHVKLHAEVDERGQTNAEFLRKLLAQPASGMDPTPFLPENISVQTLSILLKSPEGTLEVQASPDGPEATVAAVNWPRLNQLSLRAGSETLEGQFVPARQSPANPEEPAATSPDAPGQVQEFQPAWTNILTAEGRKFRGAFRVDLQRDGPLLAVNPVTLHFDELLDVALAGRLEFQEDGAEYAIDVGAINARDGALFSTLAAPFLPVPVTSSALDLAELHIAGNTASPIPGVSGEDIRLRAERLRVGPSDAPYFSGDVEVSGAGRFADGDAKAELTALINGAYELALGFGLEGGRPALRAEIASWPRAALETLLPARYAGYLERVPTLSTLSATLACGYETPAFTFEMLAALVFQASGESARTLQLAAEGAGATDASLSFTCQARAQLEQQRAEAELEAPGGDTFHATLQLEGISPALWLRTLLEIETPALLEGALDGAAQITRGSGWRIRPGFTFRSPHLFENGPWAMSGDVVLAEDMERLELRNAKLDTPMGLPVQIATGVLVFEPFEFTGVAAAEGGLEHLGQALDTPPLYGMLEVSADLRVTMETVRAAFEVRATDPGYMHYYTPYGTVAATTGTLDYDLNAGAGTLTNTSLAWNDGTTVSLSNARFAAEPFAFSTDAVMHSNLEPFVALRFLDAATGTLEATGALAWSAADGIEAALDAGLNAESLLLPDNLALLNGAAFSGPLRLDAGLAGEGVLTAREVLAAGALFKEVEAEAHLTPEELSILRAAATVFDGSLRGNGSVRLGEERMPGRFLAEFEQLDLAVFTEQMKPPNAVFTGRAGGKAVLSWNREAGLSGLDASLESAEAFSLNRDLVKTLLLTSHIAEQAGGRRLDRIVEQTLGPDSQRPFERATLTAALEGDRVEGAALLRSPALNLTIDINADLQAIVSALELRQREQLENMTGLSFGVIE